jgi:type IV secretion/conjugal transfer VirB4 family ATPase
MNTSEARKHYDKAFALHTVVPTFKFIDDSSYFTTAGEIAMVLRIHGREAECLLPEQINDNARAFEQAVNKLSSEVRIYQYLCRRRGFDVPRQDSYASELVAYAVDERASRLAAGYSVDAYMVLIFDRHRVPVTLFERLKHFLFHRFSVKLTGEEFAQHLRYAHAEFSSIVGNFRDELSERVPMEILSRDQIFYFWRYLLNLDHELAAAVKLQSDQMVGWQAADSDIEAYRRHLMIGDRYAAILSLKNLPMRIGPNALKLLARVPAECVVMTEFHRMPNPLALKLIDAAQRYLLVYSNIKLLLEMFNAMIGKQQEPEKPDQAKQDASDSLDLLKSRMLNEETWLGKFSAMILVHDTEQTRLELMVQQIHKSLAEVDITMYRERLGLLRAWHAMLPGNSRFNVRNKVITNENYADLSFQYMPQTGDPENKLMGGEYLIGFETATNTPFLFNFQDGDCPHGIICGSNGSGKSFLANALLLNAQKYSPYTMIFDMGGSYREITRRLGGAYAQVDISDLGFRVNPFSLPETDSNVLFIAAFLRVLMESGSTARLEETDKTEIHRKVLAIYKMAPQHRCLQQFFDTLPVQGDMKRMRHLLSKWVHSGASGDIGAYAKYFDNTDDTFHLARFQCFDYQGMERFPDVIEPLLFYVLHRSLERVHASDTASTPKLFLVDEAWRFFRNETTKAYIIGAMKTWRKHRAAVILSTQNPDDLVSAGLELIIPEAKTMMFLHNSLANEAQYQSLFKLNDEEIRLIRTMRDKRDILIKNTELSKLVQLIATEGEHELYSSTPQQQQQRKIA